MTTRLPPRADDVATFLRLTRATNPMRDGVPPAWATSWGFDAFGAFAAWEVPTANNPLRPVVYRMRWVPPVTCVIGSPVGEEGRFEGETEREVSLTRGFWIGETPVTQRLWHAIIGRNPALFAPKDGEPDAWFDRPVEQFSWNDVVAVCESLNRDDAVGDLGLPTDAEWEVACRAGSRAARYGDSLDEIAWFDQNAKRTTHPVAQKLPNALGLYDTLGNVWEWSADGSDERNERWHHEKIDPFVTPDGRSYRVLRGGSWDYDARYARAATRLASRPAYAWGAFGFRLARGQGPSRPGRQG